MRFTKLSLLTTSCAPALLALPTAPAGSRSVWTCLPLGRPTWTCPPWEPCPSTQVASSTTTPALRRSAMAASCARSSGARGGGWKAWVRLGLVHGVSGRAAAVAPPAPSFPASPIAHLLNAGPPPPRPAGATCRVRLRGRQSCASVAPRACASPPSSATSSSAPRVGSAQDEWVEVHFVLTQRMQLVGVSTDMTCI